MLQKTNDSERPDYPKILHFFENLLRESGQCRLEQEYPLVFSAENQDRILLVQRGQEIHAGLATLPRAIEIAPDRYAKALFVGSVVTNPESRRQGYQRQLFEMLEERAEEDDIDFLVLWSNQVEFYQKLGFFLGGLQASWFVEHKGAFGGAPEKAKIALSSDLVLTDRHFESFLEKRYCVKRDLVEQRKLARIPRMKIAYTDRAYALLGKGEDFQGVCHEWAGPAAEVVDCFRALCQSEGSFRILSPGVIHHPDEMEVVAELEKGCVDQRMEYLGLMKILSDRVTQEDLNPETLRYPFFIWGLDSI